MLVARIAGKNDALATVYHLRLATIADALFLSSASAMHEVGRCRLSIKTRVESAYGFSA